MLRWAEEPKNKTPVTVAVFEPLDAGQAEKARDELQYVLKNSNHRAGRDALIYDGSRTFVLVKCGLEHAVSDEILGCFQNNLKRDQVMFAGYVLEYVPSVKVVAPQQPQHIGTLIMKVLAKLKIPASIPGQPTVRPPADFYDSLIAGFERNKERLRAAYSD